MNLSVCSLVFTLLCLVYLMVGSLETYLFVQWFYSSVIETYLLFTGFYSFLMFLIYLLILLYPTFLQDQPPPPTVSDLSADTSVDILLLCLNTPMCLFL